MNNTFWHGTCRACNEWRPHERDGKKLTCCECGGKMHIDDLRSEWQLIFHGKA